MSNISIVVTNAVNIHGDGTTEIIGKGIKAGDYLANTALEIGSLYITDIVQEGLNTPSPNNILPEPYVPETIQDLISNTASSNISKSLQREWKYKDSPNSPLKNPPYKPNVPSIPPRNNYHKRIKIKGSDKSDNNDLSILIKSLSLEL